MINNLTPEQLTQIPTCREKWRSIALSTERINRPPATEAVNNFYQIIGIKPPTIIWFDSPYAALFTIAFQDGFTNPLVKQFKNNFFAPLLRELKSKISSNSYKILIDKLKNSLEKQLKSQFNARIKQELRERLRTEITEKSQYRKILDAIASQCLPPELLACWGSLFDFACSELNCNLDQQKWLAFQSVVNTCGWIFPFGDTVIVCDRPTKISFNDKGILHAAEGEPAISFVDDYNIYAYNGVILPVEYGMLPPSKWDSKWLLKNHPVELKIALIQGIGKTRIKQELTAEEFKLIWAERAEYIKEQKAKKPKGSVKEKKKKIKPLMRHEERERLQLKIEEFEEKWRAIAFKKKTKKKKADLEKTLKKISLFIGRQNLDFRVVFFKNPARALEEIINDDFLEEILKKLVNYLRNQDVYQLQEAIINNLNHTDLGMITTDLMTPVFRDDIKTVFNFIDFLEVYSPLADLGERLEREISSQIDPKFKETFFPKFEVIPEELKTNLEGRIYHDFIQKTTQKLLPEINSQVGEELEIKLGKKAKSLLMSQLTDICKEELEAKFSNKFADSGKYYQLGAWLDFCISVLGCKCDGEMWSVFQDLATNCPWIYAKENVCVVAKVSVNHHIKVKARFKTAKFKTAKKRRGSLKKPPMPLWKQMLVNVFLLVFGWPLLVISDAVNFSINCFQLLWRAIKITFKIGSMVIVIGVLICWGFLFLVPLIVLLVPILLLMSAFESILNNSRIINNIILLRRQDAEGRLHAEGKAAIIYIDGSREYYHHGVELLDPRYWVHPNLWQASWLLTEPDPEYFNVLIEEIGYAKVCMKLRTRTLSSWREYSLLELVELMDPNDRRFVRILKMTCPSTGSLHALRVPPDVTTARQAIRWTNWETDPEEFVVET